MFGQLFKRGYHAVQHAGLEVYSEAEKRILGLALNKYVPQYGFAETSLLRASRDLGYNSSILAMFEKDPVTTLVQYNFVSKRLELQNNSEQWLDKDGDHTKTLRNLVSKRLLLNQPILPHYKHALSIMALPQNLTASVEELMNLSDELHYLSSDNSNDFSWYTKRMSLATVYVQAELHMLQNEGDFESTLRFTNKALDSVDELGSAYNNFEEWTLFNLMSLVNIIKSQLARG